jgi:hypothetical protein
MLYTAYKMKEPGIPAFRRLGQKAHEFKTNMNYPESSRAVWAI